MQLAADALIGECACKRKRICNGNGCVRRSVPDKAGAGAFVDVHIEVRAGVQLRSAVVAEKRVEGAVVCRHVVGYDRVTEYRRIRAEKRTFHAENFAYIASVPAGGNVTSKMPAGGKADNGDTVRIDIIFRRVGAYIRHGGCGIVKRVIDLCPFAHGIAQNEAVVAFCEIGACYRFRLAVGGEPIASAGENYHGGACALCDLRRCCVEHGLERYFECAVVYLFFIKPNFLHFSFSPYSFL